MTDLWSSRLPGLRRAGGWWKGMRMVRGNPIFNIWRAHDYPREDVEAEIRALCRTIYLGDHVALTRVLGRYKMYVDTRDIGIASHLMMEGYWEMWVTEAIMRAVQRGATVIDVGANLGYFTILMADLVGPEGKVLAFEPNRTLAPLVRRSIEINGFGGYTKLHDCALGSEPGFAVLETSIDHPGGGHIVSGSGVKSPDMMVRRLDSFEEAMDVSVMKIDVEGFEQEVWKGMTAILDRDKPLTMFMEFTVSRFPDPGAFLDDIASRGFTLNICDHRKGVIPITRDAVLNGPQYVDHMLVFEKKLSSERSSSTRNKKAKETM